MPVVATHKRKISSSPENKSSISNDLTGGSSLLSGGARDMAIGELGHPSGAPSNGKKTRNSGSGKPGKEDQQASQESDSFYKMYNKEIKVN